LNIRECDILIVVYLKSRKLYNIIALCNKVYQWLVAGQWFSPGTPISSTDKTDCHDIARLTDSHIR
jgi:hypothetical protein